MVLTILSKIGLEFSVFVYTFHSVRFSSGATWKMPSVEEFIEYLTQEQTKLINMGNIKGPKVHALTVQDGRVIDIINININTKEISIKYEEGRKGTQNPSTMPPDPKVEREEKGRNEHIVIKDSIQNLHVCRKMIDLMTQILHKNNLGDCIPEGAKKKNPEDHNPKKGNSIHALIAINSSPDAWIVDSGASHHMDCHKRSLFFIGCMQRSSYSNGGQLSSRCHWQRKD
jgi:hypothetical protein